MFLRYIVLYLFCGFSVILFSVIRILYFYISACQSMFALTSMPISLVPWCHASQVCRSGTLWKVLICWELPLLLLVTLLFLQPTCDVLLLLSSVYLKILAAFFVIIYLSPAMALPINKCGPFSPYHGLWCPVNVKDGSASFQLLIP